MIRIIHKGWEELPDAGLETKEKTRTSFILDYTAMESSTITYGGPSFTAFVGAPPMSSSSFLHKMDGNLLPSQYHSFILQPFNWMNQLRCFSRKRFVKYHII